MAGCGRGRDDALWPRRDDSAWDLWVRAGAHSPASGPSSGGFSRCRQRRGSRISIATSPTSPTSPDRRATGTWPNGSASSGRPGASKTSHDRHARRAAALPGGGARRDDRAARVAGLARGGRGRERSRHVEGSRASPITRSRRRATSPARSSTRAAAIPENYDWLAAAGHRSARARSRSSATPCPTATAASRRSRRSSAVSPGILIYSDPADDGYKKGKTFPDGPWGPESHIQRGGIPFDFLVPGDPLTPGWASVPGAQRIEAKDAVSIPKIISVPLSYRDARVILEALGGPEVPPAWRGGLPISYRAAAGPGRAAPATSRIDEQGPRDPDRDGPDPRRPSCPTRKSSSATIATRGCSAAWIPRADPRR